ncbi:lysylphosphatidylglycerol synthase domain-containing protein [Acidiferrobacter sp.]|uniref:lysylphosphatidylglycerol synthase domain-containing protein n=1 Tax=Acidiferrobacter sp. TaxID=1872107 RepID=UPI0026160545|nr:lysylphosphatidylglycerol synthase domain-containing protein [Acidiferrobacter sp.]
MPDVGRMAAHRPWTAGAVALMAASGLALTVWLLERLGWAHVMAFLARAGLGLVWLIPLRVVVAATEVRGWGALLRIRRRISWPLLVWLGMVRDAVNTFLPVARVGGELVAIRLLRLRGVNITTASASVIVETSVTLALQIVITLCGIIVMLPMAGIGASLPMLLASLTAAAAVVAVFVAIQVRIGLAEFANRTLGRVLRAVGGQGLPFVPGLDRKVMSLYRHRAVLARCAFWQLAGFAGGMVEIAVMAALMHIPLTLTQLFIFEALIQAIHSMAFVVPGALGVQEGGFVGLAVLLGIAPDAALSLALGRRLRQIAVGLPVLFSWQWHEWRQRRLSSAQAAPTSG